MQAGSKVDSVVFGDCPADVLKPLGRYDIKTVHQITGTPDDFYSPEVRVSKLIELISSGGYTSVIMPGTLQGREMAPVLAARLDAGLVSDCVGFSRRAGRTEAVINIYGGQYQMVCELSGYYNVLLMADINYGVLELPETGEVSINTVPVAKRTGEPALRLLETFRLPATELEIGEADIVVGIGRGIETGEDYRMMQELGGAIGAPIGGTRPAVDAGWIPFEKQIGQTGRIIAPELYVAAGISGAVQHITGVEKAKIVAINNDPQAPILRLADLGVIGDFRIIVPLLVRKLQALGKEGRQ
ncbi:MAG: electron transfer flavoprotein subunit alpha/FixB family protein [Firmicutes bacterium]|nr:electron transfer flavoprotein subunit alpha/FixB family protein [Bacillota bacterium]